MKAWFAIWDGEGYRVAVESEDVELQELQRAGVWVTDYNGEGEIKVVKWSGVKGNEKFSEGRRIVTRKRKKRSGCWGWWRERDGDGRTVLTAVDVHKAVGRAGQ